MYLHTANKYAVVTKNKRELSQLKGLAWKGHIDLYLYHPHQVKVGALPLAMLLVAKKSNGSMTHSQRYRPRSRYRSV